jgi:FkbM family methyltransferase
MNRVDHGRHMWRGTLKRCAEAGLRLVSGTAPPGMLEWGERFCAVAQGKGWGTATIATEVSACLALLRCRPENFVDIGANVGNYTAEVLKRYPDVRCLVIEPAKLNMLKLRERFRGHPHVTLRQCALDSESGQRTLYSDIEGSGLASLTKRDLVHRAIDMELREDVQTMRFDELSSTWLMPGGRIDYIKIDVEGHELEVLAGFGVRLRQARLVQFEFGGCNIDTRTFMRDFWTFFERNGFLLHRITASGPRRIWRYSEALEHFVTTNFIAVNEALV